MITEAYVIDFPINHELLHSEVNAFSEDFQSLTTDKGILYLYFNNPIIRDDLDTVIEEHEPVYYPSLIFRATTNIVESEAVVSSYNYTSIGGVVVNMSFFVDDVNKIVAKIAGQYKSDGSAVAKIVETQDTSVDLTGVLQTEDTKGLWKTFEMYNSTVPRESESVVTLESKLIKPGHSSFRFTGVTLLEVE